MANFLNGFLSSVFDGATSPKGSLGDFQHAARLYNSQAMEYAPKVSFLYHVVFNINPAAGVSIANGTALNMLVKEAELPKFKISVDRPIQYNRKKAVQTRLDYNDVSLTFHDDNAGITTSLWSSYYGYYYGDSKHGSSKGSSTAGGLLSGAGKYLGSIAPGIGSLLGVAKFASGNPAPSVPAAYKRNTFKGEELNKYRYGLDNSSTAPFFTTIQIFQLAKHNYQCYTLINPLISGWDHASLNNSSSETLANRMTIAYESVIYAQGSVSRGNPSGFAAEIYDHSPSALRSTSSLFGTGGVLDNVGSLLSDTARNGFSLGTLIKGVGIYKQTKSLTKEGLREEGYGIVKGAIGATAGIDTSGVANTLFPKSGGNGQNQPTPATAPTSNVKQNTPSQRQAALASNPALKQSLTDLAIKSGVVPPGAGAAAAVDGLVDSGRNIKLNGLADKLIATAS